MYLDLKWSADTRNILKNSNVLSLYTNTLTANVIATLQVDIHTVFVFEFTELLRNLCEPLKMCSSVHGPRVKHSVSKIIYFLSIY